MKVRDQQYKVDLRRVIDGDTLDVRVNLGFGIYYDIRVRLADIDTPETYRPKSEEEKDAGEKCKAFLESVVKNKNLYIRSYGEDIYDRYTADLFYDVDGEMFLINDLIKDFMNKNHLEKDEIIDRIKNGPKS